MAFDDVIELDGLLASELGVALRYPDYRAGLRAVAAAEAAMDSEAERTDGPPRRRGATTEDPP